MGKKNDAVLGVHFRDEVSQSVRVDFLLDERGDKITVVGLVFGRRRDLQPQAAVPRWANASEPRIVS